VGVQAVGHRAPTQHGHPHVGDHPHDLVLVHRPDVERGDSVRRLAHHVAGPLQDSAHRCAYRRLVLDQQHRAAPARRRRAGHRPAVGRVRRRDVVLGRRRVKVVPEPGALAT
jgi:hypothetical protein